MKYAELSFVKSLAINSISIWLNFNCNWHKITASKKFKQCFFSLSSFHQLMIYKKRYANFSLRFYFHFETMYLMYSINIPWHIKATVCARAGFSLCLSGVLPQAQRRERVFQHLNYNYCWRVSCDWISSLSEWFFCSLYPSVFSIFRRNSLQIGIFDHVFLDV